MIGVCCAEANASRHKITDNHTITDTSESAVRKICVHRTNPLSASPAEACCLVDALRHITYFDGEKRTASEEHCT